MIKHNNNDIITRIILLELFKNTNIVYLYSKIVFPKKIIQKEISNIIWILDPIERR